ncbi:MAG: hybrid sensor histidine kinase/response regulator [Gemmatimonadetes bacterium]|nr:MAG: hybrid sensor histidine kinase/response regulator [Gemmatimonadota bacterium]
MEQVRVLMIEDEESDAVLICRELARLTPPPDIQHVRTQPAFVAALEGFAPHVILCDHNIPGFSGWEALELAQRSRPDVPFILVTGSLDEETAVRYLKGGASDYILKDRLVRLGPALLEALERARQRETLRRHERLLRQIIDANPSLIFVKDWDGRFVLVNQATAEIYGTTVESLIGKTDADFNPNADEVAHFLHYDRDVMSSGHPRFIGEERVTNPVTRETRWFQTIKVELHGHERQLEDLEEIRKAARRAAALTRQLLAFSRKQVLEPRIIDLNGVVMNLDKMLRSLISENIELKTDLAADLAAARADPNQIEQVVMNLAINARDAMPDGGTVTIETRNATLDDAYAAQHVSVIPGDYIMLAVTDTGCGMDEPTKSRIFEPFFTTKPVGHGTGLGLSTVYGIVKQSGGNIWVYSEPGKGTTFKIYLPAVASRPEDIGKVAPAEAVRRGGGTVLVVEDDEQLRRLTHRALAGQGYTVLEADRGSTALDIARRHKGQIDLLLTDVIMPDTNGRKLAETIRAARPGLRVLYMSGYPDGAIASHGMLEPGVAYLAKPFTTEAITRKVREVLEAR